MPMTGANLAAAVKNEIAAIPADARTHDAVWNAIGSAIVAYITANALVTITTATATGVTAGPAAVPVTGVGVIT